MRCPESYYLIPAARPPPAFKEYTIMRRAYMDGSPRLRRRCKVYLNALQLLPSTRTIIASASLYPRYTLVALTFAG